MDWTSIITALVAALVPTGGLTAIVTLRDKKNEAFLNNVAKLNNEWKAIADERLSMINELKADIEKRDAKIEAKDKKIDKLYSDLSAARAELDHTRTDKAVLEVLRCEKTDCTERRPPFGRGSCIECNTKKA